MSLAIVSSPFALMPERAQPRRLDLGGIETAPAGTQMLIWPQQVRAARPRIEPLREFSGGIVQVLADRHQRDPVQARRLCAVGDMDELEAAAERIEQMTLASVRPKHGR